MSRFCKLSANGYITVRKTGQIRPVETECGSDPIVLGKFVSESKFRDDPAAFIPHIRSRNREVLEGLITKPEVERKLLLRLRKKAATYAQEFSPDGEAMSNGHVSANAKIDVDGVVGLYENHIIPLTREVEVGLTSPGPQTTHACAPQVDYLLQRLDGLSEEEVDNLAKSKPTR